MTKEIIEQIFNLGADACYHTIDQNTGNCDKEAFAKLKQDAVKLFCQPDVISSVCDHPEEALIRDKPTPFCLACNKNIPEQTDL